VSSAGAASTATVVTAHHRDYLGAKIGMWLFLFTEILLFGGLFLLYAVYRWSYATDFHHAAMELDVSLGTMNTVILLTSSLTMAASIAAIRRGQKKLSVTLLVATIVFAIWFLVNKYFEWGVKIEHGLYPNSPVLLEHSHGEIIFFGLYFSMTGLHGVHVLVGAVLLAVVGVKLIRKPLPAHVRNEDYGLLENSGLYWHLVDLIWIFLFPLFYLIT
jgi:cytochrome c oxidase subunit 3